MMYAMTVTVFISNIFDDKNMFPTKVNQFSVSYKLQYKKFPKKYCDKKSTLHWVFL